MMVDMSTLEAWTRAGRHVARIRYGSEITLTYDDDVTVPISTSLPIGRKHNRNAVTNFLDNLLPEYGYTRAHMADAYGVPNLIPDLLVAAGDLSGAYVFTFKGDEPSGDRVRRRESEVGALIDALRAPSVSTRFGWNTDVRASRDFWVDPESPSRFALAGMQGKFAITRDADGAIWHTNALSPSTHILKPQPESEPQVEAIERATMSLARRVGLDVPEASIETFDGRTSYVVERFDRDGAQYEDLMQSMGMHARHKYSLGVLAVTRHLMKLDDTGNLAHEFVRQLAFNVMAGNTDSHGKNYSLRIAPDGSLSMSPLYDALTSSTHPHFDQSLAMGVVGAAYPAAVARAHWAKLATRSGMDVDRVVTDVISLANAMRDNLDVYDDLESKERNLAIAATLRYIAASSR